MIYSRNQLRRGAVNEDGQSREWQCCTRPETALEDYQRLFELAEGTDALHQGVPAVLKDSTSWHFPMPGANTTPWQLEGTILALRQAGFGDLVCAQNQTVVTNAFKGEDLNGYVPIFHRYSVPVRYNFRSEDMAWIRYRAARNARGRVRSLPPIPCDFGVAVFRRQAHARTDRRLRRGGSALLGPSSWIGYNHRRAPSPSSGLAR